MSGRLNALFDKLRFLFVDDASCVVCDDELSEPSKYGLCDKCMSKIEFIGGKCCLRCGKPSDNEAKYCLSCQNEVRYFDSARSAAVYESALKNLLIEYKFYGKRYLAGYLSGFLDYAVSFYGIEYDVAVPVPLSEARAKERRYDQVAEMLRFTEIKPVVPALEKIKDNLRQSELKGKDRKANVRGVYKVTDKAAVKNKRVLLIDDIITTGATVNEAARVIMVSGAKSVTAVSVAHARYRLDGDEPTLTGYEIIDLADLNNRGV